MWRPSGQLLGYVLRKLGEGKSLGRDDAPTRERCAGGCTRAGALESSHVVTGDISLTYFSCMDFSADCTILTAMISRVQSYEKL